MSDATRSITTANAGTYYLGNPNIKRHGVEQTFTEEEVLEYNKCRTDPVYFTKKYVKIINLDEGLVPFKLYPYQEKMYHEFNDNRFSIVLACRQSGKSISSCAYLTWYAIFHSEQSVAILANKGATAKEMLSRITLILENLPFFLQPGCKSLNKTYVEFSNESRIITASTSSSSIRGQAINLLFLDEFAFIDNDVEFYTSTYPVISSGKKTKIIITSTANGVGNVFHKLWEGAANETNEFSPFRVDWWDVPGRDKKWKAQTIANTSEIQFNQEFGNTFAGKGNTLIAPEALLKQMAGSPLSISPDQSIYVYEDPIPGHNYIMSVDVGKGRGNDYTTWTVVDISVRPFKQVCVYHNNEVSPLLMSDYIYKWGTAYNDAYVLIESNDAGAIVCNGLYYDLEYENMHVESTVKAGALGVTMTKKVKRIGCSTMKDLIEENKILLTHGETIRELSTFAPKGASYAATGGNHDDLVMNLVLFSWFATSDIFNSLTDINLKDLIYNQKLAEMRDDMLPFGFVDDGLGVEDNVSEVDAEGDYWSIGQ
tara:strand:- start:769 stop:2388 length:1620 start_codon:yes stop_codon:yes gene_type:complete